jgi:hypothetical protein
MIITRDTAGGSLEIGITGNPQAPYYARIGGQEAVSGGAILDFRAYAADPGADKLVLEAMRQRGATHLLGGRVLLMPGEAERLNAARHTALEAVVPGLDALTQAYRERAIARNDILSAGGYKYLPDDEKAAVDDLEAQVSRLEREFPRAASYIFWSRGNPRTYAGRAARLAAAALLDGASMEEAYTIAIEDD